MDIENLLKMGKESEWLEFKEYWYWDADGQMEQKQLGEFLKDFVALFNAMEQENRYLIIGVQDECGQNPLKHRPFYIDRKGNKIRCFENIELFHNKIVDWLSSQFIAYDTRSNKQLDMQSLETKRLIKNSFLINKKNDILIFIIKQTPFLLEIKNELQSKSNSGISTQKKGFYSRGYMQNSKQIGVVILSYDEITSLMKQRSSTRYPHVVEPISIERIIEAYVHTFYLSASFDIEPLTKQKFHNYQLHKVSIKINEHTKPIEFKFIYFSRKTSQEKSINEIYDNKLLTNEDVCFLILDRHNDKGEPISKLKIENSIKEKFSNKVDIKVYHINEFIVDVLGEKIFKVENIFFDKNGMPEFIVPNIKDSSKQATFAMSEWLEEENYPLIVIDGIGGIGKTTMVENFLVSLKQKRVGYKYILFVKSEEIVQSIQGDTAQSIEHIFDFYKIFIKNKALKNEHCLTQKAFELVLGNGNLLLVLDGLDEVIANLGNRFKFKDFIESILLNCSEFNKTKVIVTCRDYFWNREEFDDDRIKTISLKEFDKKQVESYFQKVFAGKKDENLLIQTAMKEAQELAIDKENKLYIPFVLHMIQTGIKLELFTNEPEEPQSIFLLSKNSHLKHRLDYIIGRLCERETYKLKLLKTIDHQIQIFIKIAVEYGGAVSTQHLENIIKSEGFKIDIIEKFKGHPLLEYDNIKDMLTFKYGDVLKDFFYSIAIVHELNKYQIKQMDTKIQQVILRIEYRDEFAMEIVNRLDEHTIKGEFNIEELKLSFMDFLELIEKNSLEEKISLKEEEKLRRLSSKIFVLIVMLSKSQTEEDRTCLLQELYLKPSPKEISFLSLIDVASPNQQERFSFDFSNLTMNYCYFSNYDYFVRNKFNQNTIFKNTIIKTGLYKNNEEKTQLCLENFKHNCEISKEILTLLNNKKNKQNNKNTKLREIIKNILRAFYKNGSFHLQNCSEIDKKFSNLDARDVLNMLLEHNIIIKTEIDGIKRKDKQCYNIANQFCMAYKIFEEPTLNIEFEEIVNTCIVSKQNI